MALPRPAGDNMVKVDFDAIADKQRMMTQQFKDTEKNLKEGVGAAKLLAEAVESEKLALQNLVAHHEKKANKEDIKKKVEPVVQAKHNFRQKPHLHKHAKDLKVDEFVGYNEKDYTDNNFL